MNHVSENISSSDWGDSTANSMSGEVALAVAIGACILIALACVFLVYGPLRHLKFVAQSLRILKRSIHYFAVGFGALIPFAMVGGLVYLFSRSSGPSQTLTLKIAGFSLLAFVGIALFGVLAERVSHRFKQRWNALKQSESEPISTES